MVGTLLFIIGLNQAKVEKILQFSGLQSKNIRLIACTPNSTGQGEARRIGSLQLDFSNMLFIWRTKSRIISMHIVHLKKMLIETSFTLSRITIASSSLPNLMRAKLFKARQH